VGFFFVFWHYYICFFGALSKEKHHRMVQMPASDIFVNNSLMPRYDAASKPWRKRSTRPSIISLVYKVGFPTLRETAI
jgi:hypothetical protein